MANVSGKTTHKGTAWPRPAVFTLGYFLILAIIEWVAFQNRIADPLILVLTAPIILAAFHYSRWVYWGMALFFATASNLLVLALYPYFSLMPAHQVIVIITLTAAIMAEVIHFISAAQVRAEQALRNSEQSQRALIAIAERQAQELTLLDNVRTALASELDLVAIYHSLVENIVHIFGYTQVSVYQRDGDAMVLEHQVGYPSVIERIPLAKGIIGRVGLTGQPILLRDVHSDPAFLGAIDGIVSEVCVPLFDHSNSGSILAVLNVESTQGIVLGEADLQLMKGLSIQAGVAIGRARLHAEVKASEERFRTLLENLGEGVATIDGDGTFCFANPAAESIFGVPLGTLVGRNLKAFTTQDKLSLLMEQIEAHRAGKKATYEIDILCFDGEKRGLLVTGTPQFSQSGCFTGTLAVFHDITVRQKMEEELRYLSTHDTLTRLYNRAYFETELSRLQLGRQFPISIFMVDVDGMKTVNDAFGHPAGDELLQRAAKVLRSAFRCEDVVARFGGDEFTILVPGANLQVAQAAAQRLKSALENQNKGDHPYPLSLSVGMATGENGCNLNEILKQADIQMYLDKLNHHQGPVAS